MSGTGKRGADRLNMIGIVVVGICGAALTYVSIILLEAFYMADTTAVDRDRAHESPNSLRNTVKAGQLTNISEYRSGAEPNQKFIPIERAMELVVGDAQRNPSLLVPAVGPSRTPNMMPQYGRAPVLAPPAEPTPPPADPAAVPTEGIAPAPATTDATVPAPGVAPTPASTAPAAEPTKPAPATTTPAAKPAAAPTKPAAKPAKPAAKPAKPAPGGNAP